MTGRKFDTLLDQIIAAMPIEFDAHQAQQWYKHNFPRDIEVDLERYSRNEHMLAIQLSKAIDNRSDVQQVGKSAPSTNLRGRNSTCTKWRKTGKV